MLQPDVCFIHEAESLPHQQPSQGARQRFYGLDYLRLAAVFLIVAQHSLIFLSAERLSRVFLFADGMTRWDVPTLFLISGFLAGARQEETATDRMRRLRRLLIPYASWGLFYTLLFASEAYLKGVPARFPALLDVFSGINIYFVLWFLPMLTYCTVIGWAFTTRARCLAAGVSLLFAWLALVPVFAKTGMPAYCTSAIGFAVNVPFFASCFLLAKWVGLQRTARRPHTSQHAIMIGVVAATLSGLLSVVTLPVPPGVANALGLSVTAAAGAALVLVVVPFSDSRRFLAPFWSSVAPLGIYLTHMLSLEAGARLLRGIEPMVQVYLPLLIIVGFFGAAAAVAVLSRVPILRPALGLGPVTTGPAQ